KSPTSVQSSCCRFKMASDMPMIRAGERKMAGGLKTGDHVRVERAPGSPWQGMYGTIAQVIVRPDNVSLCEYSIIFDGKQRWFRAEHLTRTVPTKWLRFFRNEAIERWKLDLDKVAILNGDRGQLVELVRDNYAFTIRRAEAEVDEFYAVFE